MEGYSLFPVEASAVFLMRLRERAVSCAAVLQYCCQAAGAALQLLWARAYQLLWGPAVLRKRDIGRNVRAPQAPGTASEGAVARKRDLRIAINKRIVSELLDTSEKQPQNERCFLEMLVKDIKTMVQFTPV